MNRYEIDGMYYEASNEYAAVKAAYKMAHHIEFGRYLENEAWEYWVIFSHGKARVIASKS